MADCLKCGKQVRPGAKFCGNCGASLEETAWGLEENELARIYEVDDVPGWFTKPLTIKPNQKALIFIKGKFEGVVPGGVVDMGGLKQRILNLGRAKTMQAVVIHDGAVSMPFAVDNVRTADGFAVALECVVRVQVHNEMVFYRAVMGSSKVFTEASLRRSVYEPLQSAVPRSMATVGVDEVRTNVRSLEALEEEVTRRLTDALEPMGLQVADVTVSAVRHEGLDLLDQTREGRKLAELEADEEIDGEETKFGQDRQRVAQEIRREDAEEVEDRRKRLEIREQVRALLLKDRMADVRATQDELDFLAEVDKQGLMRADEVDAVRRALDENNEDHELDRQHALELLAVRQASELLDARSGLTVAEIEAQIRELQVDLERQGVLQSGQQELELRDLNHRLLSAMREAESQVELDRTRYEADLEKRHNVHTQLLDEQLNQAKTDAEVRQIETQQDQAEMGWLMSLKERKDRHKLQIAEAEQAMQEGALDRDVDRTIKLGDAEHTRKMEMIERMADMPIDQLMAVVEDNDRAALLAQVKQMEITAGMSEEQIMAVGAKESPALAEAIKARFVALAEAKSAQDVQAMGERMMAAERAHTDEVKEVYERSAERSSQQADKAIDAMRDVAKSSGGSGTTVVLPSGQVIEPGAAAGPKAPDDRGSAVVICRNCRQEVPAGDKFCPNCGEDM